MYDLMTKCHALEASERPNFSEILSALVREQAQYEVPTTDGSCNNVSPDAKTEETLVAKDLKQE